MLDGATPPPRQRPHPRPVRVAAVTALAPHLVEISLTGDTLDGFHVSAPTQHIKLLLPAPGQHAPVLPVPDEAGPTWPLGTVRPSVRTTYTPRRWNPTTKALDVVFALHSAGPGIRWASSATVGDQAAVAGPSGQFKLPSKPRRWLIAGDESALPADRHPPRSAARRHNRRRGDRNRRTELTGRNARHRSNPFVAVT